MTKENAMPHQTSTPRYFTDKRIDYLNMDTAFIDFAEECQADAQEIADSMEEAIATRHHDAQPVPNVAGLPNIWYLETDIVGFYYQVKTDVVVIGSIRCKTTRNFYEPRHDLMADFEP